MAYYFYLKYDDEAAALQLPIPPESLRTRVASTNKSFETIAVGEVNLLKDIGLRALSFKVLLPNEFLPELVQSAYGQGAYVGANAAIYLDKFREFKLNKKPVRLLIIRIMPDGQESFRGNILVSLESYEVLESGAGDYMVELHLKEYRYVRRVELKSIGTDESGNTLLTKATGQEGQREKADSCVVKRGDSLWSIAKTYLSDGARYAELAQLNGIADPNRIAVGQVIRLR